MKKILPAQRTKNVHYAIRDIIAEAKQLIPKNRPILPLNIGDPNKFDFTTPAHIREAVIKNLKDSGSYSPSEGLEEAREAVVEWQKQFGVQDISPEDVLITTGGAEAISLVLRSLLAPEDNILLPSPSYPQYEGEINFLQSEIRYYHLDEANDWQIDLAEMESRINKRTKAIVIINPNNPTGAVFTKKTLEGVLKIAQKHQLVVIADEQVYPFYIYEGRMVMSASLGIKTPILSIGSMSKTYFVPGWRIGWLAINDPTKSLQDLKETIFKLKRLQLTSPHPFQKAMPAALLGSHSFLAQAKAKLVSRRDLLVEGINKIQGLSLVKPKGAFYAFVRIDLPIKSDKEFVLNLAKETGILCVPGEGFGQKAGSHHFRLVFLPPEKIIEEALTKLAKFTKKHFASNI